MQITDPAHAAKCAEVIEIGKYPSAHNDMSLLGNETFRECRETKWRQPLPLAATTPFGDFHALHAKGRGQSHTETRDETTCHECS